MILIFVVGALLRGQHLAEPWIGHHHAWCGAVHGNIARNFVRYGYWTTRFGPVANTGHVPRGEFIYFYHYGPLFGWLVSISYHVLGVHEWSARLVPLLFSLATMALLYAFARRLFSEPVALLALLLCTFMPVEAYYGARVDINGSVAYFFPLLAIHAYAHWVSENRSRDLFLCAAAITLGCMTAWYTFFLVPLMLAHCRYCYGKRLAHRFLVIAFIPFAVFALFLAHRQLLLGSGKGEVFGTLLEKLFLRISYENAVTSIGTSLGPVGLAMNHAWCIVRLCSPPLAFLAAVWLLLVTRAAFRKQLQPRDWLLLMLLGYGFLHNLMFPNIISGHDFLVACYAPGISLAAAVVLVRYFSHLRDRFGLRTAGTAVGVLVATMIATCVYLTEHSYAKASRDREPLQAVQRWAAIIRANSQPAAVVLTPARGPQVFCEDVLRYYAEREIEFGIDTPQKTLEGTRGASRECLFVCPAPLAARFKDILAHLDRKYSQQQVGDLLFYTIGPDE
jgi:4-amino-4-deoxy-L-arabinose transferase-like glycosyltransferase